MFWLWRCLRRGENTFNPAVGNWSPHLCNQVFLSDGYTAGSPPEHVMVDRMGSHQPLPLQLLQLSSAQVLTKAVGGLPGQRISNFQQLPLVG